jgi:aryl-alcohol dehydrogenase-like predicted oxidoreductase
VTIQKRTFGRLGWPVSAIGFGGWAIGGVGWGGQDDGESIRALHKALDLGCNFIDTAQGYGEGRSERFVGRVLKERKGERVYVATKIPPKPGCWPPSPYDRIEERYPEDYDRKSVEISQQNLQTDCLDLLQLHTWTRAWNNNPTALQTLTKLKVEGKVRGLGISTPEQDQNSVIELIRAGWLDAAQIIYNIFEQEPAAELFHAPQEKGVAVIVRVAFDEGALTGKFNASTRFGDDDFRHKYFAGDRLSQVVKRVEKIKADIGLEEPDLATVALKFALKPPAVVTVIAGTRNERQAEINCAIGTQPPLSDELELKLRRHAWRRGIWYGGKE